MTTIKLDPGAALLLDALHGAGHAAYAVGGCVRDSLLGLDPHDWDLCTSARPEQVMALFGEEKCIPTGLQHGTVTVMQDGRLYETTTFRTEGAYSDGRHPDAVCFVPDVREDLARRDFTINAMAYSAEEGLIDPFGGRDDLAAHLVRAVGEPERRFEEDALRILRLYRFAARFGFAIDPATGAAARALGPHLDCVSAERIQEELLKLLAAPRPGIYLEPAVLAVILPELEPEKQPERFAELCRTIDRIEPTAENVPARLAALLCPLGEAGARKALRKLKCSNALTDEVTALEREAGGGAGSFLLGHESGHSIARPIALRATGSHPSGRSSEKLSAVLRLLFLLSDLLQVLHAVLEAVEESIHILRGVIGTEGHPDGSVDGKRVAPHGCQRVAGLTAPAGTGRGNVDLRFGQECQHRFALDAVFTEVQHLRHGIRRAVEHHFREGRQPVPQALVQRPHGGVAALHGFGKAGGRGGKAHGVRQVLGAGAQAALLLTAEVRRPERLHQTVRKVERTLSLIHI